MALTLHAQPCTDTLDAELAAWTARLLQEALAARGKATLVVSGGRTPLGLFRRLREADLDWSRVMVTLADERWVPEDHADSNARLVREHLLIGLAAAARFVSLKTDAADPVAGARLASEALAAWPEPFDVVILGMGEDGHTASLFPDSPQIVAGLSDATGQACLATENATKAPRWRITLTAPRLLNSRNIALHATGAAKWALIGRALSGHDAVHIPVRFALNQYEVPCHVFWCC